MNRTEKLGLKTLTLIFVIILAVIAIAVTYYSNMGEVSEERLIVSTTTSLYETGLLDALGAKFQALHPNIKLSFISQGTGLAIQTVMRGDADMLLVHDPLKEKAFLQSGYGVNRKVIAYNFFVIVGPGSDPAGISGMDPLTALTQVKGMGERDRALWVSRGDDSGTHSKEKALWETLGFDTRKLREQSWYIEAGAGMSATLMLANEKQAYTLTDLGTYIVNFKRGNIDLVIHVKSGQSILNVYSAIAANPKNDNLGHANFKAAMVFIEFLTGSEAQDIIANYGREKFGEALFNPAVKLLETNSDPTMAGWIRSYAFIDGSECPEAYRYDDGGLSFIDGQQTFNR